MEDVNSVSGKIEAHFGKDASQRAVRVTVTYEDTGEVAYSHSSKAGFVVSMEKVRLESRGVVEGVQQIILWGNPLGWFYGWDQLKNKLAEPETRGAILAAMESGEVDLRMRDLYRASSQFMHDIDFPAESLKEGLSFRDETFESHPAMLAMGYGFKAHLVDEGRRFVCPFVNSANPGSGRFDFFLDRLVEALPKPLAFSNFTNDRLRAHLERRGVTCE